MKNHLSKYLAVVLLSLIPMLGWGQAQVFTKKARIANFLTKTTKIVLTGNQMFDSALKEDVARCWRVTPYEFCEPAEFDGLKNNGNYYFLRTAPSQDIPGIMFMSLIKGGKEDNTVNSYYEICQIPVSDSDVSSMHNLVFISAYIDILQKYMTDAMESDKVGYAGIEYYCKSMSSITDRNIYIDRSDIGQQVKEDMIGKTFDKNIIISDSGQTEQLFIDNTRDAVIGVMIAPQNPEKGSYCYKMLVSADGHELLYFDKHKCIVENMKGFQANDLKEISKAKRKK